MVDSVSPLVCTISAGPLEAVFSMIGIRSSKAGLHGKEKKKGKDKKLELGVNHQVQKVNGC